LYPTIAPPITKRVRTFTLESKQRLRLGAAKGGRNQRGALRSEDTKQKISDTKFFQKLGENLRERSFGRLEVISRTRRKGDAYWKCKCSCGNYKEVGSGNLRSGSVQSCGCLSRSLLRGVARYNTTPDKVEKSLLKQYQKQATERGLSWELSSDQFHNLLRGNCHYCNLVPSNLEKRKNFEFRYSGVDRVDSSDDYVVENVVSCCKLCQRMKMALPVDQFLEQVKRIFKHISREN